MKRRTVLFLCLAFVFHLGGAFPLETHIILNETTYTAGEEIVFFLQDPPANATLIIHSGEDNYKYLGNLPTEFSFTPPTPGNYSIVLQNGNATIEETTFVVVPAQRPRRGPNALRIHDSKNRESSAAVKLINRKTRTEEATVTPGDEYDFDVAFTTGPVKNINFKKLRAANNLSLGIEDVPKEKISSARGRKTQRAYAIDPTNLTFTNATVTAVAQGTELWKCKEWNFTTQTCFGTWKKLFDITPGQEYTFLLTPADPGFVETTRNITYQQSPDIILTILRAPEPITPNQSNTINITLNVTNGNDTAGFGSWVVNVTLWNITRGTLDVSLWTNVTQNPAVTVQELDIGDLDNDGDPDIIVITDVILVYYNNGSTFNLWPSNSIDPGGSHLYNDIRLGDMDGDGDSDVVTIQQGTGPNDLVIISNNTGGTIDTWSGTDITLSLSTDGKSLALADFDNDGDMDIVSGDGGGEITIWSNDGGGSYSSSAQTVPSATSVPTLFAADIDADGQVDVVSGDNSGDIIVWTNNGGAFSSWSRNNQTVGAAVFGVKAGDVQANGSIDVAAVYSTNVSLFTYAGSNFSTWTKTTRTFTPTIEMLAFGDVDVDNDLDILLGFASATTSLGILENNGSPISNWPFTSQGLTGIGSIFAIDNADFDNDGDLDIAVGNSLVDRARVFTNPDVTSTYVNSTTLTFTNASNETQKAQLDWTPAGLGIRTLLAVADTGREFAEILETNNLLVLDVNLSEGIADNTTPNVTNLTATPDPVEVGQVINISANVTDDGTVSSVLIEVTFPDSSQQNYTGKQSGTIYYNESVSTTQLGSHTYKIYASDTGNNLNDTETGTFTVQDTTNPAILNLTANPEPVEAGQPVNLSANATDNFGVAAIIIEVTFPDTTQQNFTTSVSGDVYWNTSASTTQLGSHTFKIYANDTSNNRNDTETATFTVQDTVAPAVTTVTDTPDPLAVNNLINISATVTDTIGVDTVIIEVTEPDSVKTNYTTRNAGTVYWNETINATKIGIHNYTFYTNDTSNNRNDTEGGTFDAQTNPPPTITFTTPTLANDSTVDHNWIYVNVSASDDNEANISFYLFDDTQTNINTTTLGAGNRSINFTNLADGEYYYNVTIRDLSDNENSTETRKVTLDTTPPIPSVLNITPNPAEFQTDNVTINWSASDATLDTSYANVTYPNGTLLVQNTSNFTLATAQLSVIGNYTVTIWANDSFGKTNQTSDTLQVHDTTAPVVVLLRPSNNSGDNNGEVLFEYNVTDSGDIDNCSIILNNVTNVTGTAITKGIAQSFFITDIAPQNINWSITCFDEDGNQGDSATFTLGVVLMTKFGGNSTNLSAVENISNVVNFTLDRPTTGKIIIFNEAVDLSGGADLDTHVIITENFISIDSEQVPELNKSATLYLYNLPYVFDPTLIRDGAICSTSICTFDSYTNSTGDLVFNVTGFTAYTSAENTRLVIWDETDPEEGSQQKFVFDQTRFFANYTNRTSGGSVNGTGVNCSISFLLDGNWTSRVNMTFNASTLLYEYNRSLNTSALHKWNVSCVGAPQGYENLEVRDIVVIRQLDFIVQPGQSTIATGQNGVTIVAGTDYTAPSKLNASFIRIVSTRLSGVGHDSGGGTQDPDEFMASIEDPENLLNNVTFRRYSTTGTFNTRIYWEIVEYTGPTGGTNEIIVRDQDEINQGTGETINGSTTTVDNDNDTVVFITGQRHNGASDSSSIDRGLYTAEWLDADDIPSFTRGDGTDTSALSYAIVEFTGSNWIVQRVEHTYGGTGEEREAITPVSSENKTFIHAQLRTASGNLDEQGQRVWLSSTNNVSFQLDQGGVFSRVGVAWVIENNLTTGNLPNVQQVSGTRASGGGEPDEWVEPITSVARLITTSIMGETATSQGGGSSGPRGPIGLELQNTTAVNLWRSDTGQQQDYRFEVLEWPTGITNFPPTEPEGIFCNDSSNCDIEVDSGVNLKANGSVDVDNDSVTYAIEVSYRNTTYGEDEETGEIQTIALDGAETVLFDDDFSADTGLWAYTGTCTRITGDPACRDGSACILCTGAGGAGEDGTAINTQDLSSYNQCVVNFWRRATSLEGSECGTHRYFDTIYNDVLLVCNPNDDDTWTAEAFNYTGLGYTLESESELKFSAEASGGGDFWRVDNVNLTCYTSAYTDTNTSWIEYQDVQQTPYRTLTNITITLDISVYNNSGSSAQANNDSDLELSVYNGTDWVSLSVFSINTTGNFSIWTENAGILSGWISEANRDIRIRGVYYDFASATQVDEINWTGVWIRLEGQKWVNVGNHTEGSDIHWNTSNIAAQTCVDMRSRAIDINGSNSFSEYLQKNACLNITHPTNITGAALNVTLINQSHHVLLTANITDNEGVNSATAMMLFPNGTSKNFTMTFSEGHTFNLTFMETNNTGVHSFTHIFTVDNLSNTATFTFTSLNFTVTASPPGAFNLLTPVNNTESANLQPNLTWEPTTDEHFNNYTILFDQSSDFSSPDFTYYNLNTLTNTSRVVDFALDANTIYYWRVIAYDDFGSSTNSTDDFIYITDTVPPTVTLNTPLNNTYIITTIGVFNFTPADANTVANCTLYHNASGDMEANETNTTVTKDQPNFIGSALPDGVYIWAVSCTDVSGNTNATFAADNRTVIVDLTAPVVTLVAPANNTYENTTNNVVFVINASDVRADIASCELIVNGVVEQTESSVSDGVEFNFTEFLLNDNYNWSVNCTDENGFEGASFAYNLTVNVTDNDPPLITLNFPADNGHLSVTNVSFNYTPEDATGIENCSIFIDGVLNLTDADIENFVPNYFNISNFTEGQHNWSVECVDNSTENNIGTSAVQNFTIDLTDPVVVLNAPLNNTYSGSSSVTFNYTPTDTNLNNCTLYGNFSGAWSSSTTNTSPTSGVPNLFTETLSDGVYRWNVLCLDVSGRATFADENYTINVDTTAPQFFNITVSPLSPATYAPGQFYYFNITWTDNFTVDTVFIEHNFTGTLTNVTITELANNVYNYTTTDLAVGDYSYRWYANDTLNNRNQTGQFTYTVDQAASIINLTLNGTDDNYTINEGETVNITAILITPTVGTVDIYQDGVQIQSGASPLTNISTYPDPGTYNITAIYNATHNYTSSRETHFIIVNDITPPVLTLIFPPNATTVTLSTQFRYNVSDDSPIENCSLFIDDTFNQTDTSVEKDTTQSFNVVFEEGNYSWYIECFDTAGNRVIGETRNLTASAADAININVTTDKTVYERGEIANITNNVTAFGNPTNASVTTDTIYGNTSLSWWNTSWQRRKPILITSPGVQNLTQVLVQVNITGLNGNIGLCANETRIIRNDSQQHTEIPVEIISGDDSTYCYVRFLANVTGNKTNATNYYVYYNYSDAINPNYNILKANVQRDDITISGTSGTDTLSNSVDTDKAFILFTAATSSNPGDDNQLTPDFQSSNQVRFTRYGSGGTARVSWQVVEHQNIYVQHGEESLGATAGAVNVTLGTAVNPNQSFIIVYGRTSATGNPENNEGFFRGRFINSTTITLDRQTTGAAATVSWQVVEWTGATVRNGSTSFTGASTTQTMEEINVSRSFLIFHRAISGDTGLDANHIRGTIDNATQLTFTRVTGAGTAFVDWFVVEFDEPVFRQNGTTTVTADVDVPITSITEDRTFHWHERTSTGGGTTYQNALLKANLTNQTNIRLDKETGSQTNDVSWQVIQFFILNTTYTDVDLEELHTQRDVKDSGLDGIVSFTYNTTDRSYGNYSAVSVAIDASNNTGSNNARFVVVPDTTPPNITLIAPPNATVSGVGFFNFTYVPFDINLDNCTLYIEDGGSFNPVATNNTPTNNENNTFFNVFVGIGIHEWNVQCNDTESNVGFAEFNFTLNITTPDLKVNESDIWFGNELKVEDNNITIFANVTNLGLTNVNESFNVSFWLGNPASGGTQINGNITVDELNATQTVTVNVTHTLIVGLNEIFVTVDPNNVINESDVVNNNASRNLTVSLYHIYHGNVSSGIILDTNTSQEFMAFGNLSNTSGHLLIADTDSSFTFSNLFALTRTEGGGPTGNDFTDVDTNLNTGSFNDSIRNVWGGGTDTPIKTATFSLTTGDIDNVPITNSTDNETFITGILWDAGDDASANDQYDTTDDEDLIFITRINKSQAGRYGTYDYEIAVPSRLKTYKASTDTVTFYSEII